MIEVRDEEDLVEAVAGAKGALRIRGGGTRPMGRPVVGEDLSLAPLSGITLYEPGALTLVAKAGTPLAEIEAALDSEGQRLAFEPMDHRVLLGSQGVATIGGAVAGNVSGPRRIQAGACRDSLLGVRFVDGQGQLVKNGGRVMKNVTGYDLVKLICGSFGTLGVLSEVSLKVLPKPETTATLTFHGLAPDQAVPAMAAALRTPFEVSGAVFGPYHHGAERALHLRLEGAEASVRYRAGTLAEALKRFGAAEVELDREKAQALWADWRDCRQLAPCRAAWKTVITPGRATEFCESLGQTLAATHYLDWGGGLIWTGASDAELERNAEVQGGATCEEGIAILHGALRDAISRYPGHTTLVKAPEAERARLGAFPPEPPGIAALSAGVKAKFDPRGILNPGLME